MFITLEGSEGAGKSTLIESLKKYFLNNNCLLYTSPSPRDTG